MCCFRICTSALLGVKNISSHAHKAELFKISDERSRRVHRGAPFFNIAKKIGEVISENVCLQPFVE